MTPSCPCDLTDGPDPRYCPEHRPAPASPRRVLAFTGTLREFLAWLDAARFTAGEASDPAAYEWELTASIARHPAGKGLLAESDAIRRERWSEVDRG